MCLWLHSRTLAQASGPSRSPRWRGSGRYCRGVVGRSLIVVAALAGSVPASQAIAGEAVAPGFRNRPLLVKTNDGAVVHYQLERQARRSTVSVAGVQAQVHLTGPKSSSVYDAFVASRSLRGGRMYWVHVRIVSRSGGIAERAERLYLHRRWPRG